MAGKGTAVAPALRCGTPWARVYQGFPLNTLDNYAMEETNVTYKCIEYNMHTEIEISQHEGFFFDISEVCLSNPTSKCICWMQFIEKHFGEVEMFQYLNRQHQHLHSGGSYVSPIQCDCSAARPAHFPGTARRPAGCCLSLGQSKHCPELQWPGHIPAACTQPGHQPGPRDHHKPSPAGLHNRALRGPHICAVH